MKIWFAPYQLGSRSGALLRFEFEDIGYGYADLFPWPEYGDLNLRDQLKGLQRGNLTALTQKSLSFAKMDAMARKKNQSLFDGLVIPRSHFLFLNCDFSNAEIEKILPQGYKSIKVKSRRDIRWLKKFPLGFDLKIRIDFNQSLSVEEFYNLAESLSPQILKQIEFIEDPTFFNPVHWKNFNLRCPLALDWGWNGLTLNVDAPASALNAVERAFSFLILKPARQKTQNIFLPPQVTPVFMGYLDHPVGQCFAALEAALWTGPQVDTGLTYHLCYPKNKYSERLSIQEATLVVPGGAGIGFGDLLEKENWQSIYEI